MVKIKNVQALTRLTIGKLAKAAKINESTLNSKIYNNRELKVDESERLEKVLKEQFGIILVDIEE